MSIINLTHTSNAWFIVVSAFLNSSISNDVVFVVVKAEFRLSSSSYVLLVSLCRRRLNIVAAMIEIIRIAYSIPVTEGWIGRKFRKPSPEGYKIKKYTVKETKFSTVTTVSTLLVKK